MSYGMNGWNKPGVDLISRAEAIDALGKEGLITAMVIVDRVPSAQPERKTGRWIIKDNPGTGWYRITCSECGEDVASTAPWFYPNAKVTWDYCPNCGADMREVSE